MTNALCSFNLYWIDFGFFMLKDFLFTVWLMETVSCYQFVACRIKLVGICFQYKLQMEGHACSFDMELL